MDDFSLSKANTVHQVSTNDKQIMLRHHQLGYPSLYETLIAGHVL